MRTWKIAAATFWMTAGAVCHGGVSNRLAVVVFDSPGVPHRVLAAAARRARWTFAVAGVETDWTVCGGSQDSKGHCALPPAGTYVQVKIMPEAPKGSPLSRGALGYAAGCPPNEGCTTSWVFYRRVVEFVERTDQSVAAALAYVMAHEIGHLMDMRHSSSGIMKANFNRHDLSGAERGGCGFSKDDAEMLRAAVAVWIGTTAPRTVVDAKNAERSRGSNQRAAR